MLLFILAESPKPLSVSVVYDLCDDARRNDINERTNLLRFLKIHKAVKVAITQGFFVLCVHMPTAIGSDTTAGFHLYGTETRTFRIRYNDVDVWGASRS